MFQQTCENIYEIITKLNGIRILLNQVHKNFIKKKNFCPNDLTSEFNSITLINSLICV